MPSRCPRLLERSGTLQPQHTMPMQLIICTSCIAERPDMRLAIAELEAELGEQLEVLSLDCMAACNDVPAVMIEHAYCPRLSPSALRQRVIAAMGEGTRQG